MPTPHRRIGLVVDEPVEDALAVVRDAGPVRPDAAVARQAVLEGALLEAVMTAATGHGPARDEALELVGRIAQILPGLGLPEAVRDVLAARLAGARERPSAADRRRRQLALLREPVPTGSQTAQDLADAFDAAERLPPR